MEKISRNAWISYERDFLPPNEADTIMLELIQQEEWEQRNIVALGKERMQPRLMSWAGEIPYRYSGQTLPPKSFSPLLTELRQRIEQHCKHTFNQ